MVDPITVDYAEFQHLRVQSTSPPAEEMPTYFKEISTSSKYCIVAYCVFFVTSSVANVYVFKSVRKQIRAVKTRTSLLILNLCIADLIVTFFLMPMEIGWRMTIQWYGGDIMCKMCQFFRAFGLYLSSMIVICISVDRFYAIIYPLKIAGARKRVKVMLGIAWVSAVLFALPQIFVFHVTSHPHFPSFKQCVTKSFMENNPLEELVYNVFSISALYVAPLVVILFTYSMILCKIHRKSQAEIHFTCKSELVPGNTLHSRSLLKCSTKSRFTVESSLSEPISVPVAKPRESKGIFRWACCRSNPIRSKQTKNCMMNTRKSSPDCQPHEENVGYQIVSAYRTIAVVTFAKHCQPQDVAKSCPTLRRSDRATVMARARVRTLRLTLLILLSFLFCWTPYVFMTLWYIVDRKSAQAVNQGVQEALFLMAVANSILNPLIYGTFKKNYQPTYKTCHKINSSYSCPFVKNQKQGLGLKIHRVCEPPSCSNPATSHKSLDESTAQVINHSHSYKCKCKNCY